MAPCVPAGPAPLSRLGGEVELADSRYGYAYRQNRAKLLASNPACTYCGAPATTADHVVERARGGEDDIRNLVPACGPCNYKRGSLLGHRRKAARRALGIPPRRSNWNNRWA